MSLGHVNGISMKEVISKHVVAGLFKMPQGTSRKNNDSKSQILKLNLGKIQEIHWPIGWIWLTFSFLWLYVLLGIFCYNSLHVC